MVEETKYKSLKGLKKAIDNKLYDRTWDGTQTAVYYALAIGSAALGDHAILLSVTFGLLGTWRAYNTLNDDHKARKLELEYQTHLIKNDLPLEVTVMKEIESK